MRYLETPEEFGIRFDIACRAALFAMAKSSSIEEIECFFSSTEESLALVYSKEVLDNSNLIEINKIATLNLKIALDNI